MTLDGVWWDLYVGLPFVSVVVVVLLIVRQAAIASEKRRRTDVKRARNRQRQLEADGYSLFDYGNRL